MARASHDMHFWRHPDLPWLEARLTRNARAVRYARHSHDTLSLGAVLGGQSHYEYCHERVEHIVPVSRGSVVAMNPGEVHACNPSDGLPWSYFMLYIIRTGWRRVRRMVWRAFSRWLGASVATRRFIRRFLSWPKDFSIQIGRRRLARSKV
ncbi:AraC family ligand binding domain-containing protein [Kushneria konosiri]|uniref:AraC-type arabinose-binding/dimerisation domain-containing protein n=1 Tax=Kushneria konosiri TaxID=698828 RepID=A0A2Z2H4V8_9GAMM|nr:AraC family ligand binding domain-containing protein [Kushneria konosiri]ARS52362.1 hypothetical protein B9G99_05265 [Kushneria konosiri]